MDGKRHNKAVLSKCVRSTVRYLYVKRYQYNALDQKMDCLDQDENESTDSICLENVLKLFLCCLYFLKFQSLLQLAQSLRILSAPIVMQTSKQESKLSQRCAHM